MHPFWKFVIEPCFKVLKPAHIVEIGADEGINTVRILEYCRNNGALAHIIEPAPKYDPKAFTEEYGPVFTHYQELSLSALPKMGQMDAVLIDGDHNWYTVYHELKLIEKNCTINQGGLPLIFIHDVCWPYARRDMYYNPENIPEVFRKPYARKGIIPGASDLVPEGGFNSHLYNAVYAHNFQNGVLTAVEDFLGETEEKMESLILPVTHGLGMLFPTAFIKEIPGFADFLEQLKPAGLLFSLLQELERDRVNQLLEFMDGKLRLEKKNQEHRLAERNAKSQYRSLEHQYQRLENLRKKEYADLTGQLNAKQRALENAGHRCDQLEKEVAELKAAMERRNSAYREAVSQRDQLHGFMMQISHRFDALTRSRRWRLGNSLFNCAYRMLLRSKPLTPVDHLRRLFNQYQSFRRDPSPTTQVRDFSFPGRNPKEAEPALAKKKNDLVVAVISWDVGHNPLGRAYMLAEALDRHFNVILLGPSFPRYNTRIWKPLESSRIVTINLPGKNFPEFLEVLQTAVPRIKADVIVACKPRLPSVQMGLMMKAFSNRPLFVDIDDFELSFFQSDDPLSVDDLKRLSGSKDMDLPFGKTWTRFAHSLVRFADGIFVSNPALAEKFGGLEVPHARDETRFDPGRYDPKSRRLALGFSEDDRVVMFLGTPRPHKGVFELLQAIKSCNNKAYKLCVMGTPPDRSYESRLRKAGGETLVMIPDQPFENLPANLAAADLVCLLQDRKSAISEYQLPAKVIDAVAMAVPVLATPTRPLKPLLEAGLVMPVTMKNLSEKIDQVLSRPEYYRQSQLSARQVFLDRYSYSAVGKTMEMAIYKSLKNPAPLPENALDFIKYQKVLPPIEKGDGKQISSGNQEGIDLVVFWKQNDSGIYGRRIDMLVRHLSMRPEIRRIFVFDMPISEEQLRSKALSIGIAHDRLVYKETHLKNWGLRDSGKVFYRTFIYGVSEKDKINLFGSKPDSTSYLAYIAGCLDEAGINSKSAVFWFYPQNRYIPDIVRRFKPEVKVVDIVDDHRTWPGLSELRKLYISRHYKEVLGLADIAMTNCRSIQESMSDMHSQIMLIPNACDTQPPPDLSGDYDFEKFRTISRPIIGYVGNMEKAKFDAELIGHIAEVNPQWQIVLIGSVHANPDVLWLDQYENVHFMGIVTYPEIMAYISEFDVAVMPHLDSSQTRFMNPLKLYVYCSLHIPVVTTDVANIDDFRSFVKVAGSGDEFVAGIQEALEDPGNKNDPDLEQCLAENTWNNRVDIILDAICARMPGAQRSHS